MHDEQIIALRRQDIAVDEVAARLNIDSSSVYRCIQKYQLQGKFRTKNYRKTVKKPAFSIRIIGNSEVIHVLPTSKLQFHKLLRLLQREGGEVI